MYFRCMKILRKLLLPIVPIYWSVAWLRNKCYDIGVFSSTSYNFPLICVGNLSVAGTGKSPMIMYLVNAIFKSYKVAALSRGYGRKQTGFILSEVTSTVDQIGDEPLQLKRNFPEIIVAVDADRRNGLAKIMQLSEAQVVLLDDAFQHRKVQAGLNILLTKYDALYVNDITLPTGDLREPKLGAKRADIIVVTKCPLNLSNQKIEEVRNKLDLQNHQQLFFSYISYDDNIKNSKGKMAINLLKQNSFLLVTGIANAKPLVDYLTQLNLKFEHKEFGDHHTFSEKELQELCREKRTILTTEKDYWRVEGKLQTDNLYYLPIKTKLFNEQAFNELVVKYIKETLG